jgi:hypothetical protein
VRTRVCFVCVLCVICVYVYVCVCVCVCVFILRTEGSLYCLQLLTHCFCDVAHVVPSACMRVYVCVCVCMWVCVCMCVYVCVYLYMRMCVSVDIPSAYFHVLGHLLLLLPLAL